MQKGTVKWFNQKRGFGFITPEDGSDDIFLHFSGIVGEEGFKKFDEGDEVEFDIKDDAKGSKAVNCKKTR